MSPRNHSVPLAESQHHVINPTNPGGALDDGVEDRLHVRGRAADDAEHLGRCRLMLQRLAQFCIALLDFFEQPHVLDGDHGLIGEGFKEFNLFVSERSDFFRRIRIAPIETPSRSNGVARTVRIPVVRQSKQSQKIRLGPLGQIVMNVNGLSVEHSSAYRAALRVIGLNSSPRGTGIDPCEATSQY